jgi:hypothetical protein
MGQLVESVIGGAIGGFLVLAAWLSWERWVSTPRMLRRYVADFAETPTGSPSCRPETSGPGTSAS